MVHELAHGGPGFRAPNLGHVIDNSDPRVREEYRDYMMHPHLSSTDWWSPEECKMMQDRYGMPERPFNPYPISSRGKVLREMNQELIELREQREQLVHQRVTLPTREQRLAAHREILKLNPTINSKHRLFTRRIGQWKNFVDRWKGTKGSIILGKFLNKD